MERHFKGIWIPSEIWLDKRLTITEKAFLAEIDSFSGNGKTFYKTNETIQEEYGIASRTVQRMVKKLVSLELLESSFNGRTRHLSLGRLAKLTGQGRQNDDADSPKWRHTNTIENTSTNTSKKREGKPANLEEVLLSFQEVGADESEAMAFFDYYEANGWTQGKNKPIKDWRAAARGWIRRSSQFQNNAKLNKRTGPADGSLIEEHLRRLAADSGEGLG
jgi:DNA-binding MarR family transcriptional regulator